MFYLASQSPRRAALLELLGVAFERLSLAIDEGQADGESAGVYVARVAAAKAAAARAAVPAGTALLAADTTVSCDGEMFGKPRDLADAQRMLTRLSGRWHDVLSAVTVLDQQGAAHSVVVTTRVAFCELDAAVIAAYCASGEGVDKAGAYGIQGLGGALVRRIDGSYSNVVGLPLAETRELLDRASVPHALSASRP